MATQFTNEQGRQLVGCLVFCLRADGPRRLLEWFNFTGPEKEALLKMLKSLFGEEIDLNKSTIERYYGWKGGCNYQERKQGG